MCGIAGVHFKKPGSLGGAQTERLVKALLWGIEHRGKDATGMVCVGPEGKRVLMAKEAMPAREFMKIMPSFGDEPVRTILLHTRFATQGGPENNANNHPVLSGTTFAVHNGHIGNDDGLFSKNNLNRIGEVDSEIIPALFNEFGLDRAKEVLEVLQGGFAIGVIDPVDHPDELIVAKGMSSPFVYIDKPEFFVWASTEDALKDAWGWTIGTPPSASKFKNLYEGDALHFKGDEAAEFRFEVHRPVYVPYTPATYCGTGSSTTGRTGRSTKPNTSVLCECGHTRFWHKGINYDASCMATKNDQSGLCGCEEYALDKAIYKNDPAHEIKCDGCMDWYPAGEVEDFGGIYWLCTDCAGEDVTKNDDLWVQCPDCPTMSRDLTLHREKFCTSALQTAANIASLALVERVPASEMEVVNEDGSWSPLVGPEQEERHKYLLTRTADRTDFDPNFVEWVLFRAPLEALVNSTWLSEAREECDTAYAEAEDELREDEDAAGSTLKSFNNGILVMH